MGRDTAQDLIHTNAEYEKLRRGGADPSRTPRETPQGQGPGRAGYDKQIYAEWTREEMRAHASRLGLAVDEAMSHEALVELLESRDATVARASAASAGRA